jgi:hypothetical protein
MLDTSNRDDLKTMVRELLQEILWEMEQQLPDPDIGLELRPEIAAYLLKPLEEKSPLKFLDEVKRELGLDE